MTADPDREVDEMQGATSRGALGEEDGARGEGNAADRQLALRWATVDALREVDLPRAAELEHILFQEEGPWTLAMIKGDLKAAHTRYFAARDLTGALLGYAGVALLGDTAEVVTIGVDPAVQRTGAGRALLGALLYEAEGLEVFLEVRVDNEPAIKLYETEGFEKVAVRKNYYRRAGKDAVVMRRPPEQGGEP